MTLNLEPPFFLEFGVDDDGDLLISIYDEAEEWVAEFSGATPPEVLKHAIFEASAILAAQIYPDYLEWTEAHQT